MCGTGSGRKGTAAVAANVCLVVMECAGTWLAVKDDAWRILIYYTQISNLVALAASTVYLIRPGSRPASALRFLSTVMLVLTMLVTVFVLIPMGEDPKDMLLTGARLFHHVLCPVVSLVSYLCWEREEHEPLLLPTLVTFVYGAVMLVLNGLGSVTGPYPFLCVREQSALATVLWSAGLLLLVTGIGLGVRKLRGIIQRR